MPSLYYAGIPFSKENKIKFMKIILKPTKKASIVG